MDTKLDDLERHIARHRAGRLVLSSVAVLAILGLGALGASALPIWGDDDLAAPPSSIAPTPTTVPSERAEACQPARVVPGKPVGNVAGLEGWFNATPDAPCEEWETRILDHPDTVLIYTGDNTMVEAYYRTTIDALGPFASLGEDYAVPDPDPAWPADSLVLIDARTKEILQVTALADLSTAAPKPMMQTSVFGEPYPPWYSPPSLPELVPGGAGGTLISETDTEYVFGLLRPDPETGRIVETRVTFPKGNVLVLAATDWECAWVGEYVGATESGDPDRAARAAAQLEKFPDLDVIQTYNPELGEADRATMIPRIVGGDIDYAQHWLNTSCSGAMSR